MRAAASGPSADSFQVVCGILCDQDLIAEFTERLATHIIHFGGEDSDTNSDSSDELRSAWSDSTASDIESLDDVISPSDAVMDALRSIDETIQELEAGGWSLFSQDMPEEQDITELQFSGPNWI